MHKQNIEAGSATLAPMMILVPGDLVMREIRKDVEGKYSLISHHTGTTMRRLFAHMIVFIPFMRLEMKSQREIDIVGTVPARQCQGSGARLRKAEMKDAMGSSKCIVPRGWRKEKSPTEPQGPF